MQKIIRNNAGFTLIELSIVILILSLIMVPLFNFMAQQRQQDDRIESEVINERVLASLALYIKNNGRYPCPANPTLAYGDANFGHENCGGAGAIISGDVPMHELGIPFRLMLNTKNWKYTYVVTRSQTNPATFDGTGVIDIMDSGGGSLVDNVPFVIVNPGPDGKGARSLRGVLSPVTCTGALDSENCDGDDQFIDMLVALRANPNDAGYYDDLVFYDLAREESTLWLMRPNATGGMDVVNRNSGNIGINTGVDPVTEKLEVKGGNVKIGNSGGAGGDLKADGRVTADEFFYE